MTDKKILLKLVILIFFCSVKFSFAQQIPQFAYGSLNPEFYNPGVSGITKSINASAIGRTQWLNISGHPTAQALNLSSYIPNLHGGLGLIILNSQQGVQRNTFAMVGYSFITGNNNHRFGVGVRGGIIQSTIDGTMLRAPDGFYSGSIINHNDGLLPINSVSSTSAEFSVGIFYLNKIMNVGIAGSHLLNPSLKYSATTGKLSIDEVRNISGSISFLINREKTISIKPSAFVKYNFNEFQSEGSVLLGYKKSGWIGAGYRGISSENPDAIIGFIGVTLNPNFEVGYAYEYSISKLSAANDGSHELMLHYSVSLTKPSKPEKIIFTPRF
ncbi:hypothetical protein LBMAG27_07900 [Bacteroidota bacterium]|nr:hypothetical protein LBMAG27_07900 [Bacteroidota bacterium]